MSSGIESTQPSHWKVGALVSHTHLLNCIPTHPRSYTPSHAKAPAAHTSHNIRHTHWGAHAVAHSRPHPLTPNQARRTLGPGTRAAGTQPRFPGALAPALTPPRFPSPLVFLETVLRSPPPRPEVLVVFLASLVSAPFPQLLPVQDLPPAPRRGPRPSPSPPSFQRGFPAAVGATDFPAGYVERGEESCPELPPGLGGLRPG